MNTKDILNELQAWINEEQKAGRHVDINHINAHAQLLMQRHNGAPQADFNGLSSSEMHNLIYNPFGENCIVKLNRLDSGQYSQIPLIRQTLYLLNTLAETDLKLTKLGWLPLKIVKEIYALGQPEYFLEQFGYKRINESDAPSVGMSRAILEILSWIKVRKGILSLTAKGKAALKDIDEAANTILYYALCKVGTHHFDLYDDDRIGFYGIAYSVWLLNKFGGEWHSESFYLNQYLKVFHDFAASKAYGTRVFHRLFYWLGIIEGRNDPDPSSFFDWEVKKTDLLSVIFKFEK